METNKDILNKMELRKKPGIPEGFFEQFWDDLSHEIEFESTILGQLKKREKPSLPENYFNTEDKTVSVDDLIKREKPPVPDDFFANFKVNIPSEESTQKKTRVISYSFVAAFTAIAAILIAFVISYNIIDKENQSGEIALTENTEDYDEYLAFLEEDDIVDFLIESEISLDEDYEDSITYDTYSFFTEEEIEDYYLEL